MQERICIGDRVIAVNGIVDNEKAPSTSDCFTRGFGQKVLPKHL